ncbi:Phosphatidylinositide phosphatase SAC1, variant 2 [Clonorchis sinensis]|nr:Phosphatidylinositide phosphatase SAC1, variant 2 [Clonorchis sinensis]
MERPLGRAFAEATMDLDENEVKYESFDFHRECGSTRWDRLSILLDRLIPDLLASGQFHLDLNHSKVVSRQTGVFRSNCIDCLDRTNVVQSMLAWCALERALITIGQLSPQSASTSASASTNSALAQMWSGFGFRFRSIWADNADYCSLQYTGTRALKTDFTRTGKRTLRGMLMDGYHSLLRYYMNNFTDGFRQDAMHLFLGQYLVHDADGTPKPLTGPGGRGRRGSGRADTEWRTQFLPLVFTFALAMSVLCVAVPTAHWTEQVTYVLFWGTASVLSAFAIFAYGEEFVDRPRFCPD